MSELNRYNFSGLFATGSTLMAVGPSQLPAPQPGTLSRILSGTPPSVQTVSDVCWKRICLLDTSAFSTFEVLDDNCAIYLLTYLLTYLSNSGNSDDLEWPSWSFIYFKPFQIQFFVQLCSSWLNLNWYSASRGPSAITELLVYINGLHVLEYP